MASSAAPLSHFTLKLYNQMAAGKSENFFISPFSISTALAMCQVGARNETAQQLKQLLSVDHLSDQEFLTLNNDYLTTVNSGLGQNVKINTANKIYPHNKFQINKEFTDLLTKHFQSEVELVNYGNAQASADTINSWVAKKTGDKIKDLIDPSALNDLTRLVLVNAIYFKGDWKSKFQPDQTTKETFYMSAESSKEVDMMKLYNKKFNYVYSPGGLSAGVLELPYVGDSIAMTIILPNEGTFVEEIEQNLTPEILHEILTGYMPEETINLQLPKFKLEYKQELSEHMKTLGAVLPFDEAKADFSGVTKEPTGLYISAVLHKAVVEVNEEGSEAAAATGVVMMTRMARLPSDPIPFTCNRPFLFIIHDKNKHAILFYGKYAKAI